MNENLCNGSSEKADPAYLNAVEWLMAVERQETRLTKEGLCETIDTTECGLGRCAADALW